MMHAFKLVRNKDVSGVSGEGCVAEGVEFGSPHLPWQPKVVLYWYNYGSIGVYNSVDQMMKIHGHDGNTQLVWCCGNL